MADIIQPHTKGITIHARGNTWEEVLEEVTEALRVSCISKEVGAFGMGASWKPRGSGFSYDTFEGYHPHWPSEE